jgi:DEAD/DEAH box helicase domain-containing protein
MVFDKSPLNKKMKSAKIINMKKHPIILDVETKHTFREFGDPRDLGVTVVAIYDYATEKGQTFLEKEISQIFPLLENASYVIGYNSRSFDLPVLQAYYPGDVNMFCQFDILEDIKKRIGKRISLNDVAKATVNHQKSGHGLMAIDYYKEGKFDELRKYCLDDVLVTKDVFEYGIENNLIYYQNEYGKQGIPVLWKKYKNSDGDGSEMPLTLPF